MRSRAPSNDPRCARSPRSRAAEIPLAPARGLAPRPPIGRLLRGLVAALLMAPIGLATIVPPAVQERGEPAFDPAPTLPEESTSAGPERVIHVRVDGPIDVGAQSLVSRALREVRASDTFLLELNTPGGPVDVMWQMAQAIDSAGKRGVRTVCWVDRQALSAGAYVAMSFDLLFLVRHGTIGSSTPVMVGPGGVAAIPEELREKQYSALRSDFRAWAEAHGYPPALAEAMVDPEVEVSEIDVKGEGPRYVTQTEFESIRDRGTRLRTICRAGELLNLTGSEAVDLGFADGIRDSRGEVLAKLGLGEAEVLSFEPTRSEELASLLAGFKWILFAVGLFLAYLELKMPGFGLPGILAIVSFAAFLFGQYLVGLADFVHFIAVGCGIVLIAIELFVMPGTLWAGILGAALLLGGLFMALVGSPDGLRYDLGRKLLIDDGFNMMLGGFAAIVASAVAARFLPATTFGQWLVLVPSGDAFGAALPQLSGASRAERSEFGARPAPAGPRGAQSGGPAQAGGALVDALGIAETPLRPVGKVALLADPRSSFEARAVGEAIDAGRRVRVVEARAGRLVVELAPEPEESESEFGDAATQTDTPVPETEPGSGGGA